MGLRPVFTLSSGKLLQSQKPTRDGVSRIVLSRALGLFDEGGSLAPGVLKDKYLTPFTVVA